MDERENFIGTGVTRTQALHEQRLETWARSRSAHLQDAMAELRLGVLPWIYRASNFPETTINCPQHVGGLGWDARLITLADYLREGFEIKHRGQRVNSVEVVLPPRRRTHRLPEEVEERYCRVLADEITALRLPHLQLAAWKARKRLDETRKLVKRVPRKTETSDPTLMEALQRQKARGHRLLPRLQELSFLRREVEQRAVDALGDRMAAVIPSDSTLGPHAAELMQRVREHHKRASAPVEAHVAGLRLLSGLEAYDFWHYDRRNPPALPKNWHSEWPEGQIRRFESRIDGENAGNLSAFDHYRRILAERIAGDPLLTPHRDFILQYACFDGDPRAFEEFYKRLDHWFRAGAYEQARYEISAGELSQSEVTSIPWYELTPEQRDRMADWVISRFYTTEDGQTIVRGFFAAPGVANQGAKPPYPYSPLSHLLSYDPITGKPDTGRYWELIRQELDRIALMKWQEASASEPQLPRPVTSEPHQEVPPYWYVVLPRDNLTYPFKVRTTTQGQTKSTR